MLEGTLQRIQGAIRPLALIMTGVALSIAHLARYYTSQFARFIKIIGTKITRLPVCDPVASSRAQVLRSTLHHSQVTC
jgi:hypothetical protein